ncbi:hypothetical protein ElyMa_004014900 [Elysia marginata]|uniref:Uncharacterized protein n=1 Tax=Elysia marginata TaxID=1093978 RepID=A0AAV4G3U7_9GAST|nr:hypothetical protein ElyMa_004014900 [Elysia marginata]
MKFSAQSYKENNSLPPSALHILLNFTLYFSISLHPPKQGQESRFGPHQNCCFKFFNSSPSGEVWPAKDQSPKGAATRDLDSSNPRPSHGLDLTPLPSILDYQVNIEQASERASARGHTHALAI